MGLLMMLNGTQSETGQATGTLAKVAKGGQNPESQVFLTTPF